MKAKTAWQRKRVAILSMDTVKKQPSRHENIFLFASSLRPLCFASLCFASLYFIHSLCLIECKYQRNQSMRETYGESRDSSVTKKMKFSFLSLLHILFSSLDPYESQAELWFCHRVLPFMLYLPRDPQLYLRFSLHPSLLLSLHLWYRKRKEKRVSFSLCDMEKIAIIYQEVNAQWKFNASRIPEEVFSGPFSSLVRDREWNRREKLTSGWTKRKRGKDKRASRQRQ